MVLLVLLVLIFAGIITCFWKQHQDRKDYDGHFRVVKKEMEHLGYVISDTVKNLEEKIKVEDARLWDTFQKNISPVNDAVNQHTHRLNQLTIISDNQTAQIKNITEGLNKALDQWNILVQKFQAGVNAKSKAKRVSVPSNNGGAKRRKSIPKS